MKFTYRTSPNIQAKRSTRVIMKELTCALVAVMLFSVIMNFVKFGTNYGVKAILMYVTSLVCALVLEVIWAKGNKKNIKEFLAGSFPWVTAIILTCTLPIGTPLYVVGVATVFAILFGKLLFGGFGQNIFNPAGVGRVVVFSAFAATTTTYLTGASTTSPTSLIAGNYNWVLETAGQVTGFGNKIGGLMTMFLGTYQGALGETSALLLVLLCVVLSIRKVIDWRIPTFYVGTVFVLGLIVGFMHGDASTALWYACFHVLSGGLLFGAVFMATDPVTSPTHPLGRILYAIGAGILTVLIRIKGSNVEGVLYSILLMNMMTPLIDSMMNGNLIDNNKKNWMKICITAVLGVVLIVISSSAISGKSAPTAVATETAGEPAAAAEPLTAQMYYEATVDNVEGNVYTVSVKSFMGTNVFKVTYEDGNVKGVEVVELGDTAGICEAVQDESFLSQFNDVAVSSLSVDIAAGASETSKSVVSAVYAVSEY